MFGGLDRRCSSGPILDARGQHLDHERTAGAIGGSATRSPCIKMRGSVSAHASSRTIELGLPTHLVARVALVYLFRGWHFWALHFYSFYSARTIMEHTMLLALSMYSLRKCAA
jgi:hypothetical protein